MKRMGIKYGIATAIVVISVAVPLLIRQNARTQRRLRNALFEQQTARLVELLAENKHLSDLADRARSSTLPAEQFRELLRLRGEIGLLRQSAKEAAALKAEQQKLLTTAKESQTQTGLGPPDPRTVLAYWPKSQLTSAGYADPAAALQTALWAMNRNDSDAVAASLTPETRVAVSQRWTNNPASGMIAETRSIAESIAPASGFYVIAEDVTPKVPGLNPDLHILNIYFEKEGATRGFGLKQIGDQWKLEGIYATDSHQKLGATLWP